MYIVFNSHCCFIICFHHFSATYLIIKLEFLFHVIVIPLILGQNNELVCS